MFAYHNSYESVYRRPFGAAEVSSEITLQIDTSGVDRVSVHLAFEGHFETDITAERECYINPEKSGLFPGTDCRFTARLGVPDEAGLLWYFFILTDSFGNTKFYGNNDKSLGGQGRLYDSSPLSYQITVYRYSPVPDWYKNGLVYQIFPDSFCRGADFPERSEFVPLPEGWIGPPRKVRNSWYDSPDYEKDSVGMISCWNFYGGTLEGIREKLPHIKELGFDVIYLNPIFRALSCHRYDTADYTVIDPVLGDDENFSRLCAQAGDMDIKIFLDGVFNHTGADSIYFDKFGNFAKYEKGLHPVGAYRNEDSPFRDWYIIPERREDYGSWWGFKELPNANEYNSSYRAFICGEGGILRRWLKAGASGWRLDVVDELPDDFVVDIRNAVKAQGVDKLLIGEVWEDASNKESYGVRRKYFSGTELDGVMNYVYRDAALKYASGEISSGDFAFEIMRLKENYPPENFYGALNLLGSHDRARAITRLGGGNEDFGRLRSAAEHYDGEWSQGERGEEYRRAKEKFKMLAAVTYAMPGVPCVYYGDEAGMRGETDPYNRAAYPWGAEDEELIGYFKKIGGLYHEHDCLKAGEWISLNLKAELPDDVFAFERVTEEERMLIAANRNPDAPQKIRLDVNKLNGAAEKAGMGGFKDLIAGGEFIFNGGFLELEIPPCACLWLFGLLT